MEKRMQMGRFDFPCWSILDFRQYTIVSFLFVAILTSSDHFANQTSETRDLRPLVVTTDLHIFTESRTGTVAVRTPWVALLRLAPSTTQ